MSKTRRTIYQPSNPKTTSLHIFRPVEGRSLNQKTYIKSMLNYDYTFCIGVAGTGKTHCAAGIGAELLIKEKIQKLVLTRPIVATEDIGFLPGTKTDKIHPYLLPLFDELEDFIDVQAYIRKKTVSIEPLAFLRGRTLKNSFIILDEAQNCTYRQLKMFLTRLGEGSKMVINGDLTQSDLPPHMQGGLERCIRAVEGIDKGVVSVCVLSKTDMVRHPSVSIILSALEEGEN